MVYFDNDDSDVILIVAYFQLGRNLKEKSPLSDGPAKETGIAKREVKVVWKGVLILSCSKNRSHRQKKIDKGKLFESLQMKEMKE